MWRHERRINEGDLVGRSHLSAYALHTQRWTWCPFSLDFLFISCKDSSVTAGRSKLAFNTCRTEGFWWSSVILLVTTPNRVCGVKDVEVENHNAIPARCGFPFPVVMYRDFDCTENTFSSCSEVAKAFDHVLAYGDDSCFTSYCINVGFCPVASTPERRCCFLRSAGCPVVRTRTGQRTRSRLCFRSVSRIQLSPRSHQEEGGYGKAVSRFEDHLDRKADISA